MTIKGVDMTKGGLSMFTRQIVIQAESDQKGYRLNLQRCLVPNIVICQGLKTFYNDRLKCGTIQCLIGQIACEYSVLIGITMALTGIRPIRVSG